MHRIIIDTDGSVDDALARLFALPCPDVRIEAITAMHGNVPLEQAIDNILEIPRIAGCVRTVSQGSSRAPDRFSRFRERCVRGLWPRRMDAGTAK